MLKFRKCLFDFASLSMLVVSISQPAFSLDSATQRLIHDAQLPEASQLEQVNDFIAHNKPIGKKPEKTVRVSNGQIFCRLITPLNSSFNLSGDTVQAVVIGSLSSKGKPWLEEGTILEGVVEASKKAGRGQSDGYLTIRFYTAKFGEKQIDLFTSADTDDGKIKPPEEELLTKKQRVRGVLMTMSRLAIPAAMGTSGMSIALTAGAGAAIGLAFSDKGKRIQGTVRGAWEGAGLSFLDPAVCKGRSVILPEGTPLELQLDEPIAVPPYIGSANRITSTSELSAALLSQKAPPVKLETHAQILGQKSSAAAETVAEDRLKDVRRRIDQNDLAAALTELTAVEEAYPEDETIKTLHTQLFEVISGQRKISDISTGRTN